MTTEIYYYSGSGFTLTAAKRMAAELRGDVVLTPIVAAMREQKTTSDADKVGLFMPMHAFGVPIPVREFLKSARFPKACYTFALMTRGGGPGRIDKQINRYLRRQGKRLNAFTFVSNPNTFDIIYPVPVDETMRQERARHDDDIRAFARVVDASQDSIRLGYRNRKLEYSLFPILKIVNRITGYFSLQKNLYANEQCVGCGQCAEACLSGKISMRDGKPHWDPNVNCHFCLACLHLCPQTAVQVRRTKTPQSERIHAAGVTLKDIAAQKRATSMESGRNHT